MVEALIQCDLCSRDFNFSDRVAKILPRCGHTICLACVKDSIADEKCTQCGVAQKIDEPESLLNNDKLMKIVETLRKSSEPAENFTEA